VATLQELIDAAGGNLTPDQIVARLSQASKAVQAAKVPYTPAPMPPPVYSPAPSPPSYAPAAPRVIPPFTPPPMAPATPAPYGPPQPTGNLKQLLTQVPSQPSPYRPLPMGYGQELGPPRLNTLANMQLLGFIAGMPNANPMAAPGAGGYIPPGMSAQDIAYQKAMAGMVTPETIRQYAGEAPLESGYPEPKEMDFPDYYSFQRAHDEWLGYQREKANRMPYPTPVQAGLRSALGTAEIVTASPITLIPGEEKIPSVARRPLETATAPGIWAMGAGGGLGGAAKLTAQFAGGELAGGLIGRRVGGEKGETIGQIAGGLTGPLLMPLAGKAGKVAARELTTGRLSSERGAIGKVPEEAPKAGETVAKAAEEAVPPNPRAGLVDLIAGAREAQPQVAAELHAKRVGQAGAIAGIRGSPKYAEEKAFQMAMAQTKGKLVKPTIEANVTPEQVAEWRQILRDSPKYKPFEWRNARTALDTLALGELPTPGELVLLEREFPGITKAVEAWRPLGGKLWREFVEAANIPRAVLASYDLSAPLRQGALLGPGHPKEFLSDLIPMVKAAAREKNAQAIYDNIIAHPIYEQYLEPGGLFVAAPNAAEMVGREEAFMGLGKGRVAGLIEKIPGIRQSQRAYEAFLNKLRFDVGKTTIESWQKRGIQFTEEDVKDLCNWLNVASGRGKLGKFERAAPELAAGIFSPRLLAARLETLPTLVTSTPLVRKMVARDLAAFIGTNLGLLSVLKFTGAADVELDPRSTDFGKIKVGPTRIDSWGGFQQIARTVAQIATGQRKDTVLGSIYSADRLTVLSRFFQGKLSPAAGFIADLLRGSTFTGEELSAAPGQLKAQAFNRLAPMFIQDVTDAVREWGPKGALLVSSGFFGTGTLTYETAFENLLTAKDKAAQVAGAKSFDDLATREGKPEANRIVSADAAVVAAQAEVEKEKQRWAKNPNAYDLIGVATETYNATLRQAEPMFLTDPGRANSMIRQAKEDRQAAIFNIEKGFPETAKKWADYRPSTKPTDQWNPQEVLDFEMSLYRQNTDAETGEIDPAKREQMYVDIDAFESKLTDEQYGQLQKNFGAKDSPVMALRRQALALLDEPKITLPGVEGKVSYFDMSDVIWEKMRDSNWPSLGDISYDEFKRQLIAKNPTAPSTGDVLQRSPVVKAVDKTITAYRQKIEEQVPELLATMLVWGMRTNARDEMIPKVLPLENEMRAEIQAALDEGVIP